MFWITEIRSEQCRQWLINACWKSTCFLRSDNLDGALSFVSVKKLKCTILRKWPHLKVPRHRGFLWDSSDCVFPCCACSDISVFISIKAETSLSGSLIIRTSLCLWDFRTSHMSYTFVNELVSRTISIWQAKSASVILSPKTDFRTSNFVTNSKGGYLKGKFSAETLTILEDFESKIWWYNNLILNRQVNFKSYLKIMKLRRTSSCASVGERFSGRVFLLAQFLLVDFATSNPDE